MPEVQRGHQESGRSISSICPTGQASGADDLLLRIDRHPAGAVMVVVDVVVAGLGCQLA